MTNEEIFMHVRVGHAVVNIEIGLAALAEHAGVLDPELVQRVGDAFEKFANARRKLLNAAILQPGSNTRN